MDFTTDSPSDIQNYIAAVLFPSILIVCVQQLCISPLNQDKGALPLRISILVALSCDITLIILQMHRYRFTIDISIASDAISWTLLFLLSFATYKMVDTPRHYADQHWGTCLVKSWLFVTILYSLWLFSILFLFVTKYGDLSWFPMRCRLGFDVYVIMGATTVLIVSMNVWSTLNDTRTSAKEPVSCNSPQSRTASIVVTTPNTLNTLDTTTPNTDPVNALPSLHTGQMTNHMMSQMTSPSKQMSEMNVNHGISPDIATGTTTTPQMTSLSPHSQFAFPRSFQLQHSNHSHSPNAPHSTQKQENPREALVQLSRGKRIVRWTATISLLFIFNSIADITLILYCLCHPHDRIPRDLSPVFHHLFQCLLYISVLVKHWIPCSRIASHRSMYSTVRKWFCPQYALPDMLRLKTHSPATNTKPSGHSHHSGATQSTNITDPSSHQSGNDSKGMTVAGDAADPLPDLQIFDGIAALHPPHQSTTILSGIPERESRRYSMEMSMETSTINTSTCTDPDAKTGSIVNPRKSVNHTLVSYTQYASESKLALSPLHTALNRVNSDGKLVGKRGAPKPRKLKDRRQPFMLNNPRWTGLKAPRRQR